MENTQDDVTVQQACTWIGLSRSTYYRWKKRSSSVKPKPNELVTRIQELCQKHRFRCGYRKIISELRHQEKVNHKRVQRIMQQHGWQCRVKLKKRNKRDSPPM